MTKYIIILFFSSISLTLFSQRFLLYENVENERQIRQTSYGPNKTHFVYSYLHYGKPVGPSTDSIPINYWQSQSMGLGIKYKHRLTSWWSHLVDVAYNYNEFGIAQTNEKKFPDAIKYKKEKLARHQISGAYLWRFRLGRAGNYLGKYLDLGAYGAYTFANHRLTITNVNVPNAGSLKIKQRQLNYIEDFEYGAVVKIGIPRMALYGKYRLTSIIKDANDTWKLPVFTVGLELNLTK